MIRVIETIFIASSAFSFFMAAFVLVTGLIVFRDMSRKLFMHIIIIMSACDMMGSAASAFGFPVEKSLLCPIQGFAVMFFFKASWIWTTMLTFQLFSICYYGEYGFSILQMHLLCWGLAISSTLVVLSTNSFGRSDDDFKV